MDIAPLTDKKILIVGMAGTGKTFLSQLFSSQGLKAFDGDTIQGLSGWFDKSGNKVVPPDLSNDSLRGLEWNWNEHVLKTILNKNEHTGVLILGVSSNWHTFVPLFDKVFLLYANAEETRKRLTSEDRKNDYAKKENEIQHVIKHIEGFRKFALEHGAIPLDATKSPKEIYREIVNQI